MAPEANENSAEKTALEGAGNEKHADKENSLGDRQAQQLWEKADAESSKYDKTPSQLDMKAVSEPLLLFDKTQSGSHKILASSADSKTQNSGNRNKISENSSSPRNAYEKSPLIGEEELKRMAGNDMTAAGYLRELNEAKQLLEGKALEAREKQIWQLVQKTYGSGHELRTANETPPIKEESANYSGQSETFRSTDKPQINTAEIKALAENDETARSVAEMLDSLETTGLQQDEKQRLRETIKAGFADVRLGHNDTESSEPDGNDDKQNVHELHPEKINDHTFALGLEFNASPADAIHRFGQAAFSRAAEALTDPAQQLAFWQAQQDKLLGIAEGLNQAKESLKEVFKSTGHFVQSGELCEFLAKPNAINEPLARAAGAALAAMEADPQAINKAVLAGLQSAGVMAMTSSEKYSAMSPREQGRVIGEAMFSFINPEGSLEAPQLLNQATKHSDEAIQAALQATMKSVAAEEIKGNLQLLRDLATSPELKEFFRDSLKVQAADLRLMPAGVPPAMYLELEQQLYLMNKAGGGEGNWWNKTYQKFRELAGQAEKSASKSADDSLESILTLNGEAFIARAVDKMVQPIDSSSPAFSHWQKMKEVLKTIPEEDLRTLLKRNWEFHFPQRLEDVDLKLAKSSLNLEGAHGKRNEILAGITKAENLDKGGRPQEVGKSVVPFERWSVESNSFIANSDGYDLAGVTRHEVGQALNSIHHWYCRPGVVQIYRDCADSLRQEIEQLQELVRKCPDSIAAKKTLFMSIKERQTLIWHLEPKSGYGIEQTLTDLYATSLGGCGLPKQAQTLLEERFAALKEHMNKSNWFREMGDD
ncbi:MAG TPA: hypothetical protein EYN91_21940 [Candidatus Melainabacteria bacterium]|nr:hypothetical protein [Candidatus Melainabacteria bacterium]HIN66292.1 hypothetical protein [Candidatus Obscuribacterales bacterium]